MRAVANAVVDSTRLPDNVSFTDRRASTRPFVIPIPFPTRSHNIHGAVIASLHSANTLRRMNTKPPIPIRDSAKTHYRTIFLSDIHLGRRGCRADTLLEFLKTHTCDQLYLVGDIIDGWRFKTVSIGHKRTPT